MTHPQAVITLPHEGGPSVAAWVVSGPGMAIAAAQRAIRHNQRNLEFLVISIIGPSFRAQPLRVPFWVGEPVVCDTGCCHEGIFRFHKAVVGLAAECLKDLFMRSPCAPAFVRAAEVGLGRIQPPKLKL